MDAPPIRTIKLGGSLLDSRSLKADFQNWLAGQSPARNVLVVGGGRLADQVRYYDDLHGAESAAHSAAAHAAAILTMSATARLAASLLGELPLVTDCECWLAEHALPSCVVLDPFPLLDPNATSQTDSPLPQGWHVTSDSIAAFLAQRVGARELVLLKSTLPALDATWEDVAQSGLVDEYFPRMVDKLSRVRIVDLRDRTARQWHLQSDSVRQ